jgi:predicted DNA-binding transcriptional regulator YafY
LPAHSNGKLRLLYTLEILRKYSDEENPLNSADIIRRLESYDITAERKTVYEDLDALLSFGYDIIKTSSPKTGWFLGEREFEAPEIFLLCDAVRSAKFISPKKTRELLSKLNSMLSESIVARRKEAVFFGSTDKCGNEEIYYSIDKISRAIEERKQLKLSYYSRLFDNNRQVSRNIKEMTINPYALTWQDDHYYLIGNHIKYDNLIHLRLDKITSAEILNTPSRHFSEVSPYSDRFDTADYTNKLFGMFSGEVTEIQLCCNKKITEQVLDRFSEDIFITNVTDTEFSFRIKAAVSPALVTWIMNYGSDLKVLKPDSLKEMITKRAEEILNNY